MITSAFGTAQERAADPGADGMRRLQRLAAVELEMHLDEDPRPGGAGLEVVVAEDARAGAATMRSTSAISAGSAGPVHQRVPGAEPDPARAEHEDARR